MNLLLVGLNHKTAPIEVREKVAFPEDAVATALQKLRGEYNFKEALIVSTCNRVEILVNGNPGEGASPQQIRTFLAGYHQVDESLLTQRLYSYRDQDLVRHVFRVASSLDSMVPGEAQILGQLKQAYGQARRAGSIGTSLCNLIPHAFFVAKRVRRETKIGELAVSVSSVGVELARKIFGDLQGHGVLLLGAGKMGELAAQSLIQAGASRLRIANRTEERAQELARKYGGEASPFEPLGDALAESDIVIVSTGAKKYLVDVETIEHVIRERKYAPLFLIDISVPRNVDPAVNEIDNVFVYDIDDLQSVIETNLQGRQEEAEFAEKIIIQEVENFTNGYRQRNIGPVISAFRRKLEEICLEELTKEKHALSSEELQRMERVLIKAAHRIAHPLLIEMKRGDDEPAAHRHTLEVITEAFDLED